MIPVYYGIQRWLRYSHGGQGLRRYCLGFAVGKPGFGYLIKLSKGVLDLYMVLTVGP